MSNDSFLINLGGFLGEVVVETILLSFYILGSYKAESYSNLLICFILDDPLCLLLFLDEDFYIYNNC